jgi:hypothetical protein
MEFRISDTFTAGLAKLSGPDQKAVKTTAFDLQIDPSSPGLRYHRLCSLPGNPMMCSFAMAFRLNGWMM